MRTEPLSFWDALPHRLVIVPGDRGGMLDLPPILQRLADDDWQGWLVVEAKQDPALPTHWRPSGSVAVTWLGSRAVAHR
jgi:sugar phosphate isomerase/epimerase